MKYFPHGFETSIQFSLATRHPFLFILSKSIDLDIALEYLLLEYIENFALQSQLFHELSHILL